jgi:hypothetical protein
LIKGVGYLPLKQKMQPPPIGVVAAFFLSRQDKYFSIFWEAQQLQSLH